MPTDAQMLALAARAAPSLPADAQMAIASQGQDGPTTLDTAQSIAGYGTATEQVNRISQHSQQEQRGIWDHALPSQRQMWQGAGYKPPAQHRGFFGTIFHDIGAVASAGFGAVESIPGVRQAVHVVNQDVVEPVNRDVVEPATHVGGDVLNALGSGLRLTQHMYRMAEYYNQSHHEGDDLANNPLSDIVGAFGGGALALTGNSDWADAWDKTTHGEQTFDPNKDRAIQANSGLTQDQIGLAKAAAGTDKDLESFLHDQMSSGRLDAAGVTALRDQLDDPKTKAAVQQYKDAHLSFGRSLIPTWMWTHSHGLAEVLSGAGDLVFSFADPYLVGAKVTKAARIARYTFNAPEEIRALLDKPAAKRWLDDVSGHLQNEDYVGLVDRHPELMNVIPSVARKVDGEGNVIREGITTRAGLAESLMPTDTTELKAAFKETGLAEADSSEKLADWLSGNVVALHILGGGGSAVPHGTTMVPTLSLAGKAFLDAKGTLRKGIDWAADRGVDVGEDGAIDVAGNRLSGLIRLGGTTARRMTTLIPQGMTFDPTAPDALLKVQRFATMYLPRVARDRIVQAWATAPTVEAKRNIYLKMLGQTFDAAGIDLSDDSSLARHFIDDLERAQVGQKYSFAGNDLMENADSTVVANGLLAKHLTTEWSLPSFKELADNANRARFNKMVYGVANNPLAQSFSAIWKPLQLLRIGFPVRVAMEELAGATAREGPLAIAKAALAGKVVEGGASGVKGPLQDLNPIEAGTSRLLRELDDKDVRGVQTMQDLQARVLANRTQRFLRWSAARVPGVAALEATVRKYSQLFENGLPSEISSVHLGTGFANSPEDAIEGVQTGMRKTRWSITPRMRIVRGEYKDYQGGDVGFMSSWMRNLDDIAGDPLSRPVLENLRMDPNDLRELVADHLQSSKMKQYWDKAARAGRTSDGKIVGDDATARDAALDWADRLITHVKGLTHEWNPDGTISDARHQGLIPHLLEEGQSPDLHWLMKIEKEVRPPSVQGPEFVEMPLGQVGGLLKEFVDRGFHRIGHAIDFLSRQPMFLTAVHKADKQLAPIVGSLFEEGTAMHDEVLHELVRQRAFREVMPYIHDPKIRSQMNILTQNLVPFQFAQEQFWKRWARTFYHSPEAMREAQLAHHALGASGIVHTDDRGQEVFSYPTTGFAQQAITQGLDIMGIPASLPVSQVFSGNLKMVAPGMDTQREFMPSFGPLVSIPLNLVARQFHELQPVVEKTLGDIATGRPIWEQIVPSSMSRVINAVTANEQISPSYANAEMRAIQDLYATHNVPSAGIGPDGKPLPMSAEQRQEFMRRVSNWTRINFFLRAALGFSAPAAPQTVIGDTAIGKELRQLSAAGVPFNEAMQELMKRNPDAFPYTVFMSEGAGKEPLPATKDAAEMLQNNSDFFAANPGAGGYFLPQKASDDKFSNEAYKEQLLYELRKRRSPQEFLDQMEYSAASQDYYDTRDDYKAKVAGLKGAAKQQLDNAYGVWKEHYLHDHPIFADKLQAATAVIERHRTMENLQLALNDGRAPKTPQVEKIRDLVDTFTHYQQDLEPFKGINSGSATKARKQLTAAFDGWAREYVKNNSEAVDVWNSLIRSDVEEPG